MIRSVSPLPYYICLPYLVCTLIMEDTFGISSNRNRGLQFILVKFAKVELELITYVSLCCPRYKAMVLVPIN